MKAFIWILRLVAAAILLQTVYFKFSGSEESVYIFKELGVEPFGRIFAGISELIAAVLLIIPRTTLLGALMALGVMAGAIASHLLILGIVIKDDGGLLFGLAVIVSICCATIVYLHKDKLPDLLKLKI